MRRSITIEYIAMAAKATAALEYMAKAGNAGAGEQRSNTWPWPSMQALENATLEFIAMDVKAEAGHEGGARHDGRRV